MATNTNQTHVPAHTATSLSHDVLAMGSPQCYVCLGSMVAKPSLDGLLAAQDHIPELPLDPSIATASQGHVCSGSMVTKSSFDKLVTAQGHIHIHLCPMLTELSLDSPAPTSSQGHVCSRSVSTASDLCYNQPGRLNTQGNVRPGSTASDSSVDEPTSRDFRRWKGSWDEKMLLVRLKREGRDWEYIKKFFWRLEKTSKEHSGWVSMWQRAAHDIDVLGKAALADRESEVDRLNILMSHHSMVDAAWMDYEGIWDRITDLMHAYGTQFKWTPEKVEYAWTRGVSNIFPDIVLRQRQFTCHISTDLVCDWTSEDFLQHQ